MLRSKAEVAVHHHLGMRSNTPLGFGFKSSAAKVGLEFVQFKPILASFYDAVAPEEPSTLDCGLMVTIG
jgi:hypothetical protein